MDDAFGQASNIMIIALQQLLVVDIDGCELFSSCVTHCIVPLEVCAQGAPSHDLFQI